LKIFVLVATVGLLVGAAYLPDTDEDAPLTSAELAWTLLLLALLLAVLALGVLRLLGRSRPLITVIRDGQGRNPAPGPQDWRVGDSMTRGDVPRVLPTRIQPSRIFEYGSAAAGVAVVVLIALLLLMMIGLGVHWLSTVVGTPLPSVDDDPDRVEWAGLAELVGYGLAGALALSALCALGQRVLPAEARDHIERLIGVTVLLAVAVAASSVMIDDRDLRAALVAGACVYGAYRIARGLPLDDDEDADDERQGASAHDRI
jgi:hypothetical protein